MMPRTKKILLITGAVVIVIGLVAGVFGYSAYKKIMRPNVHAEKQADIFISHNFSFENLMQEIAERHLLYDADGFEWWARRQGLPDHLHPGRYVLTTGMNNRSIVNLLLSGRQTPVRVTFNNIRTKSDFAGRIGEQLEIDSADIIQYFDTTHYFTQHGFTSDNFMTLFIPNTYEFYWTTSVSGFMERMQKEYDNFWNAARLNEAKNIGLTPQQVSIVASIVYSENERKSEEAARIAGVYMNRINRGMKLEADPTVKFAIGDFAKKRIYLSDLEIDSPYNTYKYTGLPPGPIHMPPIKYIDAVLNYEHHDYIFMCARGDGSGLHYFAKTLAEHNRNRDLYIKALNTAGIY